MKVTDREKRIKDGAVELSISTLLSKLDEYEKAGQRGQSMSDGRGSGETPCPVAVTPETDDWTPRREGEPLRGNAGSVLGPSDPLDRDIRTDRLEAEAAVRNVDTVLQTLLGIQRKYVNARTTEAARLAALAKPPKGAGPCGNVWCDHVCTGIGDDRLRKSTRPGDDPNKAPIARCSACDKHWRRHGVERPRAVPSPQSTASA